MTANTLRTKINWLRSTTYLDSIPSEDPYTQATKEITKEIKKFLKSNLKYDDMKIYPCFCYVSCFIRKGENIVYISIQDFRHFSNFLDNILYRTAKSFVDYIGGSNCYSSLENLPKNIQALLDK